MTAINIAIQEHAIHIATDGLAYDQNGGVVDVSSKCWALPALHAAFACMGPSLANIVMAAEFTKRFQSFDDMIDRLEDTMPKIYAANMSLLADNGGGIPDTRVYIAGWSESRNRPEAYSMLCIPPESLEYWAQTNAKQIAEFSERSVVVDEPFILTPLDDVIINPPFADGLKPEQCGFRPYNGGMAEHIDPEVDLVVILQMQRLREEPLRPGLPATSKVGGHALLTTIDADGVHQRVVFRWPSDKVGEVIKPERDIDWNEFRRYLRDGRKRRS